MKFSVANLSALNPVINFSWGDSKRQAPKRLVSPLDWVHRVCDALGGGFFRQSTA